jgi:hypothetical protein
MQQQVKSAFNSRVVGVGDKDRELRAVFLQALLDDKDSQAF